MSDEFPQPYVDAAIAAVSDTSRSPEEAANAIVEQCTKAVRNSPAKDRTEADGDTPGLELFLWTFWAAFFELAKKLPTVTAFPELTASLDSLDDHLAYRTFLVGHDVTAADLMVWGALKGKSYDILIAYFNMYPKPTTGSVKIVGLLKNNKHVHLNR